MGGATDSHGDARDRAASEPTADVRTFFLDGRLLVFSERRQVVAELSGASAFAWSMLADTDDPVLIAREIQAAGGSADADDVASWISRWRADAWIGRPDRPGAPLREDDWLKSHEASQPGWEMSPKARAQLYVGGVYFDVVADRAEILEAALAPFPALRIASPGEGHPSAAIFIAADPDGYRFGIDNRYTDFCKGVDEIAPMLKMWMLELVLTKARYDLVLHASALSRGQTLLLLAAASGSGKSTLSAALARRGFALHCDDCILFSGSGELNPVSFPVTVKSGSWSVLSAAYPELAASPAYLRADGLTVKYLSPPMAALGRVSPVLVFPCYRPGGEFAQRDVHRVDALHQILEDAYTSGLRMTCEQFDAFARWISELRCVAFDYSSLDDAELALGAL